MTHEEFIKAMTGFSPSRQKKHDHTKYNDEMTADLPDSVDWRAKGCVGPVGNQNACGSCWAFTATGPLEGIHCKQTGKLIVLSVQQLMDCSSKQGNHGCEGGMMDASYKYVEEIGGLVPDKDYPYISKEDKCKVNKTFLAVTDSGYKDIAHGDEMALQAAVANVGPIAAAVDATQRSFQLYKSGVYDEPKCNNKNVDHSLVIVGYGTVKGKQFYNAKNSWGTSWGDEGYIMLSRNKNNQCGVANMASYPTGVRASK
ncbi:hypothetical protein FSP39_002446 [Pinctada imbricata]|uniref:Peptidase C1A papain C-terminal domain-containing protein n=1 Tax=Pinctada imbricata TaxID=66713 RepID=A0AA88XXT2_PINIB|nr:hypothetical protein FSP39_002446 [Pinctada imbricata]